MKDKLSKEESEALIKALNEAIEKGPWDKSNFLKAIGKKIIEIRDDFRGKLGSMSRAQLKVEAHRASNLALRGGQQEVFVSIYSATGSDMAAWERIVANLPRQMISRPIYANEEDAKAIIRHKEHKINEAYVAIYVNVSDILSLGSDKTSVDKLGKVLLTLKDKTLFLDNINRFVHLTGVYRFEQGRLIKS